MIFHECVISLMKIMDAYIYDLLLKRYPVHIFPQACYCRVMLPFQKSKHAFGSNMVLILSFNIVSK